MGVFMSSFFLKNFLIVSGNIPIESEESVHYFITSFISPLPIHIIQTFGICAEFSLKRSEVYNCKQCFSI